MEKILIKGQNFNVTIFEVLIWLVMLIFIAFDMLTECSGPIRIAPGFYEWFQGLLQDVVHCRPQLKAQLFELALLVTIIFPFQSLLTWRIIYPVIASLPDDVLEGFAKYNQQTLKATFLVDVSEDEAVLGGVVILGVLSMHVIGLMLCVPSVFQWTCVRPMLATSLACHGALAEAAWELKDGLEHLYQILFLRSDDRNTTTVLRAYSADQGSSITHGQGFFLREALQGKKKFRAVVLAVIASERMKKSPSLPNSKRNSLTEDVLSSPSSWKISVESSPKQRRFSQTESPTPPVINTAPFLTVLGIHHALGLFMVLPMNLFYPQNPYYHELVFLLLFAAASGLGVQQFSFTLNIKTTRGLVTMVVVSLLSWVIILWGRILRFFYIVYILQCMLYTDGARIMFVGGIIASSLMTLFNILIFMDMSGKVAKLILLLWERVVKTGR